MKQKQSKDFSTGITLISLVITIVLILILAGITTMAGTDSIKSAKRTSFITELEMIQEKVNTIYEKRKLNQEDVTYYASLGQDISNVQSSKVEEAFKETNQEGYRYFSKENLKQQLDLDNIEQDVAINFDTADVISITGIEIDGTKYYRLIDMPNYQMHQVEYVNKNIRRTNF